MSDEYASIVCSCGEWLQIVDHAECGCGAEFTASLVPTIGGKPKKSRKAKAGEKKPATDISIYEDISAINNLDPDYIVTSKEIYVDGATSGKFCGIGLHSNCYELFGASCKGTSNQAELGAIYVALQLVKDAPDKDYVIYSDARYSIKAITEWAWKWKKNGWKRRDNTKMVDIKNKELVVAAHKLYAEIQDKVSLKWVKGHSGVLGNERADELARGAVQNRESGMAIKYLALNLDV